MAQHFKKIALMGRYSTRSAHDTLIKLIDYLSTQPVDVLIEADTAETIPERPLPAIPREQLGQHADLVIVVGGDGSLLNAARAVVDYNVPIIGVNRGLLGFLTDVSPEKLETTIGEILNGQYQEEERFLLSATIHGSNAEQHLGDALNDVVLYAGEVAQMIEFEMYINDQFVYSQRSDGLIAATPTGSTAYALSGGGPIVHPTMKAMVLLPMFSHTLSARPIVVGADSVIDLRVAKTKSNIHPVVSCDGQSLVSLDAGAKLRIQRKEKTLRLIHPLDYNYYNTLRTKLEWGTKLKGKYFPDQEH